LSFLYKSIYSDILKKINDKTIKEGSQLPTEKELSAIYGVSRITSKRAVDELAKDGYVKRTRGKGTFVLSKEKIIPLTNSTLENTNKESNKTVAAIFPYQATLGSFSETVNSISSILQKNDYTLQLYSGICDIKYTMDLIEKLYYEGCAGIIYYPVSENSCFEVLYRLINSNYPIVTIDKYISALPLNSVTSENRIGGKIATEYLINLNHKKIAFISDLFLEETSTVRERYFGYCDALKQNNLPYSKEHIILDINSIEYKRIYLEDTYKEIVLRLKNNGITAIFCINDMIASFIIHAIYDLGMETPKDFSVIGFDNSPISLYQRIPLTTISQDFCKMGEKTAEFIINKINNPNLEFKKIQLPTELIIRDTCQFLEN
jgi:DNA-binding LacI/PurR family transcriptional regulator